MSFLSGEQKGQGKKSTLNTSWKFVIGFLFPHHFLVSDFYWQGIGKESFVFLHDNLPGMVT